MADYGAGSGSSGSDYGSGGGSSSGSSRVSGSQVPQRALFKLAARLANTKNTDKRNEIATSLADALTGYSPKAVRQLSAQYGIRNVDRNYILANLSPGHVTLGSAAAGAVSDVNTALGPLSLPGQSVQGAIATSGSNPLRGAWQGLSGQKQFTPIQAVAESPLGGNQTERQAIKTEQGINPLLRFGLNTGGAILTDPTTYLTFGTPTFAESAVRTAAPIIAESRGLIGAEEAANAARTGVVASAPGTRDIFQNLASSGLKTLSKNEKQLLSRGIRGRVADAPGGARIAGVTVPGTPLLQRLVKAGVEHVQGKLPQSSGVAESAFRPSGQMLAAERAGELTPGTAKDVQNLVSWAQGKNLEGGVHQAEIMNSAQRLIRDAPDAKVAMEHVTAARDGFLDRAALTPPERQLYDTLTRNFTGVFPEQQVAGHLQAPEQATAAMRAKVLDAAKTRLAVYAKQVERRAAKSDELNAEVKRLRELIAKLPAGAAKDSQIAHMNTIADRAANLRVEAGTAAGRLSKAQELLQQRAERLHAVDPRTYAPRYLTPEGAAEFGVPAQGAGQGGVVSGRLTKQLNSRLEATRNTPITELKTKAGAPVYDLNAALAGEKRIGAAYRDLGKSEVSRQLRTMSDAAGNPLAITDGSPAFKAAEATFKASGKDAPYQPVTFPVLKSGEGGASFTRNETIYVNKAVAPDVQHLAQLYTDAGSKWAKDAVDYIYSLWKGYTLTSTGFLAKKTEGELINGFWLTGTSPRFMGSAARLSHKVAQGVGEGNAFRYLTPSEKQTFLEAVQGRALWSGFEKSDLGTGSQGYIDALEKHGWGKVGQLVNPLSRENAFLKTTRGAANWISNAARLGLFLGLKAKGYSPAEAGRLVRKYLFDYSELSPVDRGIRYVSPFFTWTRKNVPLQLETLLKNPVKITAQVHVVEGLKSISAPHDPLAVPDWVREGGGFVAPFTVGGQPAGIVPNTPLTSTTDVIDALKGILPAIRGKPGAQQKEAANIINALGVGGPLAGAGASAYQAATGRQVFSGAPFKPGAEVPTPNWLGGSKSPFGKYIPAETAFTLQNLFPLSSKIQGVFPQYPPTAAGTSKKGRAQAAADNRAKSADKIASMLSGATFAPINDKSKAANIYAKLEQLTALENWLKSRGAKIPTTAQLGGGSTGSSSDYGG